MPLTWIREPVTEPGQKNRDETTHGVAYNTAAASVVACLLDPPVAIGAAHPDSAALYCISVSVSEINAPAINGGNGRYRAVASFSSDPTKAANTTDPISQVTSASDVVPSGLVLDSYTIEQVPTDLDINGDAIMTSSKEPVNPPPMMPVVVTNLRVIWYEGQDNRAFYVSRRNTVNSLAWRDAPARHAYCSDILAEKVRDASGSISECWRHEAIITQKTPLPQQPTGTGPFDYVFVDMGYHELNKEVLPNVNRPKLLDGSGNFQSPQDPTAPVIRSAQLVNVSNFSLFPLP